MRDSRSELRTPGRLSLLVNRTRLGSTCRRERACEDRCNCDHHDGWSTLTEFHRRDPGQHDECEGILSKAIRRPSKSRSPRLQATSILATVGMAKILLDSEAPHNRQEDRRV